MINAIAASIRSRYRQSLEKRTASLDPQTRAELARDIHSATLVGVDELREVNASIEQAQLALQDLEAKKRFVGLRLAAYREKLEQRAKRLQKEEERLAGVTTNSDGAIQHENDGNVLEETEPLAGPRSKLHAGRSPGVIVSVNDREEQGGQTDESSDSSNQNDEGTGETSLWMEEETRRLERDQSALEKVGRSHKDMEANTKKLQKTIFVLERKRDEILQKTGECRDFLVAAAHIEHELEAEDDDTVHSHEDLEGGQSAEEGSIRNELVVLLSESSEGDNRSGAVEREESSKTK